MTQERAKEILPFVEAVARGKTLQFRSEDTNVWRESSDILFTGPIECYRIKPEPRGWQMIVGIDGKLYRPEECFKCVQALQITVREIIGPKSH